MEAIKNPKISVVINTYNGAEVIKETLNSILRQTYQDFEVIIVDDCSTDNTVDVIKGFNDPRIKIYRNEKNMGAAYSAQRGVELSAGEYIAKSDQDDISYENRLEYQLKYMEKNPDIFVCGAYSEIYFDGGKRKAYENVIFSGANEFKYALLFSYIAFDHSTFFFRREEAMQKNIKYRKYTFSEDYDFLLQAAGKAKIGIVQEVLLGYHEHENQLSKRMLPWEENKQLMEEACSMLRIPQEWREIAIKGVGGEIKSFSEFKKYTQLYYYYAKRCGLEKNKKIDRIVMKYVFRCGMRVQRQRNLVELIAYISSGLCDWKFIFSDKGFKYIRHCVFNGVKERN